MLTKSYSQAGQDRFVDAILEGKRNGNFVDFGCCHPIEISNSYALETQLGWSGLLVDNDPGAIRLCKEKRVAMSMQADATNPEFWVQVITKADFGSGPIDYLSADIDGATHAALSAILATGRRFRVITCEHDLYAPGGELRKVAIERTLLDHGYDLLCRDVHSSDGHPFEVWAVDPLLVNMDVAEKYRSKGLKWEEILEKGK